MTVRRQLASAWLATVIVLGGCGSESPTAPDTGVAGVWSGTITRGSVSGRTRWELSQIGAAVSGAWSTDYDDGGAGMSGVVTGTATGDRVSLFLAPSAPLTCPAGTNLSGTITVTGTSAGERITGTHFKFTCDGVESGTVDVARE